MKVRNLSVASSARRIISLITSAMHSQWNNDKSRDWQSAPTIIFRVNSSPHSQMVSTSLMPTLIWRNFMAGLGCLYASSKLSPNATHSTSLSISSEECKMYADRYVIYTPSNLDESPHTTTDPLKMYNGPYKFRTYYHEFRWQRAAVSLRS